MDDTATPARDGRPPGLDAFFGFDRRALAFGEAATSFALAGQEIQALFTRTWWDTWRDLSTNAVSNAFETADAADVSRDVAQPTWTEFVDRGLAKVDSAVTELQHSEEYLEAERKYVLALTEFRDRQRDLVESMQLANDLPTRREVDDMSRYLYEAKRELRSIKRKVAKLERTIAADNGKPANGGTHKNAPKTQPTDQAAATGRTA